MRHRHKPARGNTATRSSAKKVGLDRAMTKGGGVQKHPFPSWYGPGQLDTKFMFRERRVWPKLKFKKYPVPHVRGCDNPFPGGKEIADRVPMKIVG